jgi:hypothetical protein
MIKIRLLRETNEMYKYEVMVSGDLVEYGHYARPRLAYNAALKYCSIRGLDIDQMEIPHSLKRIWGF